MANKSKPSIYQDRGTIGSAKELDEYGVWVKSEPQILDSGGTDAATDLALADLADLPDFSIDFDDTSASDAENTDLSNPVADATLDDFDTSGMDESDAAEEDFSFGDASLGDASLGDASLGDASLGDDTLSLDDASLGDVSLDDASLGDASLGDASLGDAFSLDESALSLDDASLDDISLGDASLGDASLGDDALSLGDSEASGGVEDSDLDQGEADGIADGEAEGSDDGYDEVSIEDLLEVADELPGEETAEETPEEKPPEGIDMSTQLLMKIATELSSIRQELSALKQEFSMNRGGLEAEHGESHGFFDDANGDDKIALTGDELNNIINTADFTEEAGADATAAEFSDLSTGASPALETSEDETGEAPGEDALDAAIDLELPEELPEVESLGDEVLVDEVPIDEALEAPVDEIPMEELAGLSLVEEPELQEISLDDAEDLLALNPDTIVEDVEQESAIPDISIELPAEGDEAPVAGDELDGLEDFEEGALDLSDAVIDAPDLGAEIQENPPLEPDEVAVPGDKPPESPEEAGDEAVEILEEIPVVDDIEDETEIARAEESAAEIPAVRAGGSRGEDLDQIIPEGFLVEELDEEGETGFGGAGLDTLDEGVSLDEIPEDILPGEEGGGQAEDSAEAEMPGLPGGFKKELKQVLSYMDQLLESLPEEKIEEFAQSEYFDTYKKLFKELGLA